jgi:YD repeat-containing protein
MQAFVYCASRPGTQDADGCCDCLTGGNSKAYTYNQANRLTGITATGLTWPKERRTTAMALAERTSQRQAVFVPD